MIWWIKTIKVTHDAAWWKPKCAIFFVLRCILPRNWSSSLALEISAQWMLGQLIRRMSWNDTTSFFDCRFTRIVWTSVYAAWGISKPHNMSNMFRSWLNEIPKDLKPLVLLGAAALCWSVWLCRNSVVFDNKKAFFLLVIYSTTHWLRSWALLQQHYL